jgi:hypothetical protein
MEIVETGKQYNNNNNNNNNNNRMLETVEVM